MKILFYDAKPYDTEMFERASSDYNGISIDYLAADISEKTAPLAKGYDAVCLFVASDACECVKDTCRNRRKAYPYALRRFQQC